jgi:hypothetical protein
VRLPPALLAAVDEQRAATGLSRAETIRRLLTVALAPGDGVDRAQIRRMLALTPRGRVRHMTDVTRRLQRVRARAGQPG